MDERMLLSIGYPLFISRGYIIIFPMETLCVKHITQHAASCMRDFI